MDVDYIEKVKQSICLDINKPEGELWIAYAGNLGNSYDFTTLLKAVKKVAEPHRYKMLFIGDGDRRHDIEEYAKNHKLNVEITGYLPYKKLLAYLSYCDIAVNIFKKETKVVYSYKFNDYAAMGCFILNSLEGETAEMIDKYKIGKNFNFADRPLDLVLNDVITNWDKYVLYRQNLSYFIDEKLNKKKIYSVVNSLL